MTGFEAKVAKLNDMMEALAKYSEDANFDADIAKDKQGECDRLEAEIAAAKSFQMDLASKFEKSKSVTTASRPQFVFTNDSAKNQPLTLGSALVQTPQFKSWQGQVEIPYNLKTTLTEINLTSYDRPAGIVTLGVQEPVVADLIPQFQTNGTTVRLFVENSWTSYAGMVGENALKPEGALDLAEKDFPVRKVAVLLPVTDEMLMDHPAVMGNINQRLPLDIATKEDKQILSGDGTGNNLLGFLNYPLQTEAKAAGVKNADAIRDMVGQIQATGFVRPNAMVCHPLDWVILSKEKDNNGQFYGGGPFTGAYGVGSIGSQALLPTYWGMRVVTSVFIPQGTILIGDFTNSCQIYRRMSITVDMSDSHANTFAYNVKTIRAESRLAFAVTRPKSFATITAIA